MMPIYRTTRFPLGRPTPAAQFSEDKPAAKSDEDLKNGPQLPGNAMSQAEIDALLASFD